MGYSTRPGTEITDFTPDDTDTTLHIQTEAMGLTELLEKIQEKWPDAEPSEITIKGERIHTRCLYYDSYDGCDWDDFIIVTRST